jgi:hypothetical protein
VCHDRCRGKKLMIVMAFTGALRPSLYPDLYAAPADGKLLYIIVEVEMK